MKSFVFASNRQNAGKTTLIMGISGVLSDKKLGYMKPFGERVVYENKKIWDYDAAAVSRLLGMELPPEHLSIGFDHSKLVYERKEITKKLKDLCRKVSINRDYVFIEAGRDPVFGCSVGLDPFSIAEHTDSKVIYVIDGYDENHVADEICHIGKYYSKYITGVIVNKVESREIQNESRELSERVGVSILGFIPRMRELETTTASLIAEELSAKIIVGKEWLSKEIESIFIGAMSASAAVRNPIYGKKNKLIITSGDRTDMILISLEHDTACILLTNNIIPPRNIIEKARERKVPILLVPWDTYTAAKRVESIRALLNERDLKKLELVKDLVKKNVDLSFLD